MDTFFTIVYLLAGSTLLIHTVLELDLFLAACRRTTRDTVANSAVHTPTPFVLVQLPVFNEPAVACRLLTAVAALSYPATYWRVQVLDDSTDNTPDLVNNWILGQVEGNVPVDHLRRSQRLGYKAGALQAGLERAPEADIVVVFDADFVPAPDFLLQTIPYFEDPRVGAVQTRWSHLNADQSWLTRAQRVMLDSHFTVEQAGRLALGGFGAFNGTAGALRARALREVGGWHASTLSEDFDVSLRLQFAGWRIAFLQDVTSPAELPARVDALRVQQRRWMRGVAQNARIHFTRCFTVALPWRLRLHLLGQLTETGVFVAMAVTLILAPMVALRVSQGAISPLVAANLPVAIGSLALLPVYAYSIHRAVEGSRRMVLLDVCTFLLLSGALTLHNAVAVIWGWLIPGGAFERTPKIGLAVNKSATSNKSFTRRGMADAAEYVAASVVIIMSSAVVILQPSTVSFLWPVAMWALGSVLLSITARRQNKDASKAPPPTRRRY